MTHLITDENIQQLAKEFAAKRNKGEQFTDEDYEIADNSEARRIVALINSYASEPLSPNDLFQQGLRLIAERLREKGMPIDISEPSLPEFTSANDGNPKFQSMAETIADACPDLCLSDFILRCTGEHHLKVHPIDFAILSTIHSQANATPPTDPS